MFKQIQLPSGLTEKLRVKIKKLFNNEQEIYEQSKKSLSTQLEKIKYKKKELVLRFLDEARTESDENLYENIKRDLDSEELKLSVQLEDIENNLAQAVKVLEIALVLANNCQRAYKKANPLLRGLLSKAFFERIAISNGQIVSAKLNAPLDFLCKNRIKNSAPFELNYQSGPGGNRTHDLCFAKAAFCH